MLHEILLSLSYLNSSLICFQQGPCRLQFLSLLVLQTISNPNSICRAFLWLLFNLPLFFLKVWGPQLEIVLKVWSYQHGRMSPLALGATFLWNLVKDTSCILAAFSHPWLRLYCQLKSLGWRFNTTVKPNVSYPIHKILRLGHQDVNMPFFPSKFSLFD